MRDHLEAFRRRTGRPHPLSAAPPLPPEAAHLWEWFLDLHAARSPGRPLAWHEIAAWAALSGERPAPWEVRALRALDAAWLAEGTK